MSEKKKKVSGKSGKALKKSVAVSHVGPDNIADVTMPAAVERTGMSMGFMYRCINDGRLPAFKVGRSTVFRASDLDKLMTPVPYTPTMARPSAKAGRSIAKAAKAAKPARKPAKRKAVKKAPKVRTRGLKAAVNKALESMTTDVPESETAGN